MPPTATLSPPDLDTQPSDVMLADGSRMSLHGLSVHDLKQLQWVQEQKFARAMVACEKGSRERALVTGQAYDTICTILAAQQPGNQPLDMGIDPRYARLVLDVLNQQIRRGMGQPSFFEIGYGCGTLLKEVSDHGYRVAGIEVSQTMQQQALEVLGEQFADQLLKGEVLKLERETLPERPSMIYWNDVFEHICPDEIEDYLSKIHSLLIRGGALVTITPNWLLRPSDVTGDFCPPRTDACGLHLKEYRLAEVSRLLKRAGFRNVATPMAVSRRRIYLLGSGLRLPKQWSELLLDRIPVKYANLLCRGLGMSVTIATK